MAVDNRHCGGDRNRYRNPYRGRGGPGLDNDEYRPDPAPGAVPGRGGFPPLWGGHPPARGGQHRGRGPKGYRCPDERIRQDINERLTDDSDVDASEVEVRVSAGEVTLAGSVDSRGARRRAEAIAESVSGVTFVQNNLQVEPLPTRLTGGMSVP